MRLPIGRPKRADVYLANRYGETPLDYAIVAAIELFYQHPHHEQTTVMTVSSH